MSKFRKIGIIHAIRCGKTIQDKLICQSIEAQSKLYKEIKDGTDTDDMMYDFMNLKPTVSETEISEFKIIKN